MTDDLSNTPLDRPAVATPPPLPPSSRRGLWMASVVGLVLVGLGVWFVAAKLPGYLARTESSTATTGGTAVSDVRKIQATVFYVADSGTELVPLSREVVYGATPVEQARRIVEAVVEPPPPGRRSTIPAGTTVRNVFLTDTGEAYVDLGGAIVSGHSGGSLDEALTVYAIVNALAVNLPNVGTVQILVEGKQVDTLVGHVDLRAPLGKALDWVRKGS